MKNFQNAVILTLLLGLISYTVYDKMTEVPCMSTDNRLSSATYHLEIPDSFSFCNEAVPLKEADVRERFDREMHVNVFWHSSTYLVVKRANKWFPRIEEILKEQGIPEDFKYLVVVESALTNVISPAGATGFWQFLPETAKNYGLEVGEEVDDRYDPIKSTYAACKYLKQAYKKFGNWALVAASYNMGLTGVENALNEQKVTSYYDLALNEETSRYLFRILAFKEIFENKAKYGFNIKQEHLYKPVKLAYVEVTESIPNLVEFALKNKVTYKTLKIHNPWLRKNSLTVENGKTYKIALPKEKVEDDDVTALELGIIDAPIADMQTAKNMESGKNASQETEKGNNNKVLSEETIAQADVSAS
ncbi:MAG: hypothetical protein OHK0038_18640 [Flammeovirgaceae bacterium]